MTQPFLKAYVDLLIQTCHKRGIHAVGSLTHALPFVLTVTDGRHVRIHSCEIG